MRRRSTGERYGSDKRARTRVRISTNEIDRRLAATYCSRIRISRVVAFAVARTIAAFVIVLRGEVILQIIGVAHIFMAVFANKVESGVG